MSKTRFTQTDEIFRKLLKELRTGKKLSQMDLAARLHVPQSYVSKYEIGERRLDFAETVLVCEALGITIEEFSSSFSRKRSKARLDKTQ